MQVMGYKCCPNDCRLIPVIESAASQTVFRWVKAGRYLFSDSRVCRVLRIHRISSHFGCLQYVASDNAKYCSLEQLFV